MPDAPPDRVITSRTFYLRSRSATDLLARLYYGLPLPAAQGNGVHNQQLSLASLRDRGAVNDDGTVTDHGITLLKSSCRRHA